RMSPTALLLSRGVDRTKMPSASRAADFDVAPVPPLVIGTVGRRLLFSVPPVIVAASFAAGTPSASRASAADVAPVPPLVTPRVPLWLSRLCDGGAVGLSSRSLYDIFSAFHVAPFQTLTTRVAV